MKVLVDMNLSPSWVHQLGRGGFEAVHWSTVGAANAPDDEILEWAREHNFVVVTNDLDFSAIPAAAGGRTPSVLQVRTQDLLSDATVRIVITARRKFRTQIEAGALLSIDESGTRARLLPVARSWSGPTPIRVTFRPALALGDTPACALHPHGPATLS